MSTAGKTPTTLTPPPSEATLAVLMERRHHLETLLAKHQASVVAGDWVAADKQWLGYFEGMDRCIREEEEFLLPMFMQRVPQTRKGLMEIFLAEHGRIRGFLTEISGLLDLMIHNPPPAAAQIVHLLEREYELKRLIEHHDTRDKNILLPELDKHTTSVERREILKLARC
ncbi:MAG: hypothetical protein AB1752_01715 [Candidatus Zixiibacteriota bacterium]